MSENQTNKSESTPKERTLRDIQVEYQQLAVQLGQTQYQIEALSGDVKMLSAAMRKTNLEYEALKSKQAQLQAEQAAKKAADALESTKSNLSLVQSEGVKTESENKENA